MNPVRTLLGSIAGLAHARLGLLATEGREELVHFYYLVLAGCAVIALAGIALGLTAAALIMAAAEPLRVAAALALGAVFAAAAAIGSLLLREAARRRSAAFAASLAQLERDREALVARADESRTTLADSGGEVMRLVSIGLLAYSIGKRLSRAP